MRSSGDLSKFPAADQRRGVGLLAALQELSRDLRAGAQRELVQFIERFTRTKTDFGLTLRRAAESRGITRLFSNPGAAGNIHANEQHTFAMSWRFQRLPWSWFR